MTAEKGGEVLAIGILVLVVLSIVSGIWVFRSKMEASAYNKVTGKSVSTWDAMWIELRVQSAPTD